MPLENPGGRHIGKSRRPISAGQIAKVLASARKGFNQLKLGGNAYLLYAEKDLPRIKKTLKSIKADARAGNIIKNSHPPETLKEEVQTLREKIYRADSEIHNLKSKLSGLSREFERRYRTAEMFGDRELVEDMEEFAKRFVLTEATKITMLEDSSSNLKRYLRKGHDIVIE